MKTETVRQNNAENEYTVRKNRENDYTVCKNRENHHTVCKNGTKTEKSALRRRLIEKRNAMSAKVREELDRAIAERVAALPCFRDATAVLLYVPVATEIDVSPLMREAWRRGIPVGLPVCDPATKTMTFRRAEPNVPLTEGAFGIPTPPKDAERIKPNEKTVCVLPALAYDRNRVRLGYGGGYYDRFLDAFAGISVGVAYEKTVLDSVCAEVHDRPADVLVTESNVF